MEDGGDDEEDEGPVYYFLEESTGYMEPVLAFLSIVHTIISFLCIIGYNCLKVTHNTKHDPKHPRRFGRFGRFVSWLLICNFVLQVPLVIFKREKELARNVEFDGLYITEQPEDDDIRGQWDRLVLNTP